MTAILKAEARRQIAREREDREAFLAVLRAHARWSDEDEEAMWRLFQPSIQQAIVYFSRGRHQ